jgi:hypothetical protein
VGKEEITLTTLDAIKDRLPAVDYLQIDVQGAELQVLRGAAHTLSQIGIAELEVRFYPIYEHEPSFQEIHEFFTKHGFILCQMSRQGSTEFGQNYVEANACYYNAELVKKDPTKMAVLQAYAKAKQELYADSVLRLLCDIHPTERLASRVVEG